MPEPSRRASVVVPAHNEEAVVTACLEALVHGTRSRRLDIVVVCNGCTDATAEVAAAVGPPVRVLSVPQASKVAALNAGDDLVESFPRFYVDADVVPDAGVVDALADVLEEGDVLVAAPGVRYDLTASSSAVRSYYRIWSRLPSVRQDVVGRGMYALSRAARERFAAFPEVLGDDHFVRDLVEPGQRRVVESVATTVIGPRTYRGLLRTKARVYAGNRELDRIEPAALARARQRRREWVGVVRERPRLLVDVPAYLGVALLPRFAGLARRMLGRRQGWGHAGGARR